MQNERERVTEFLVTAIAELPSYTQVAEIHAEWFQLAKDVKQQKGCS